MVPPTDKSGGPAENFMKRIFCLAFSTLLAAGTLSLAVAAQHDVTTNPKEYFLKSSEVPDSLAILPPPPSEDSEQFKADIARYKWGLEQRKTERGRQAFTDADLNAKGVLEAFSEAYGMTISEKATPWLFRLLQKMREDAGDLATRSAKEHYMRVRPFAYYKTDTCNTRQMKKLSTNGSYPSGHTAIGWATALVLAEINPDRQDQILKRGFEIGQSRVICGFHWQSDVDVGRTIAGFVNARLHADPAFMQALNKAKAEFATEQK